jgi:signal transduction histidine kinase
MYFTYLVLLGLAIVCNSVLLVAYHRHSQRNITTFSLFLLLLLVNIWFIPKFITNAFHATGMLFETLSRISALGYIFVPSTLVVFTLSFGAYQKIYSKLSFWLIIMLPSIIFLYLSWTSNLVGVHDPTTAKLHPWGYETPTGMLWPFYILWYDLMIIFAISVLIMYYRTMVDQTKKKQAMYFIYAIVIPLVFNTITVGILPVFNIFIFPIGLILVDVVTIVGIALIYRYNWLEVSPFLILSNINQLILTIDMKGRIVQVNQFAENILKKPATELLGMPVSSLLFLRDSDKSKTNHCMQILKLVLARGKSMTFDSFSVVINNKQELTDTFSIAPIFSQNVIVGANVFLRDTRKEKVKEKQKEDYFSMLFHELKSPLTSVKAYNQILAGRFSDTTPENKMLFLNMDKQLDRLTRLINDFFELSRIHSGKLYLQKEYFNLDDFIHGIIATMKITHKNRLFQVHGTTNSIIYADKDKIEQIIINFLNNAMKFSPENKEIIVHLTSDAKKVTIGVQDYGKGIDPRFHKKIFERFFQVGPISKHKIGLGIGLSITSTIIKAHAGKVWVDSHLGKGSTFYFSLPVSKV